MNGRASIFALALALVAQLSASAEDEQALAKRARERAVSVERTGDYQNLITQHARGGKAPDPKRFTSWILEEINHNSLMRDQIAEEISEIENEGHNGEPAITSYLATDGQYVRRLSFKPADLAIRCSGVGFGGVYSFEAVLRAKNAYHGGHAILSFRYRFKAKSEYLPYTKANQITVTGYPVYLGKTTKDIRGNG